MKTKQPISNAVFTRKILAFYDKHGRKDLPWKQNKSAYSIWLSEIMLQQTQVATVIPYFQRFTERFPTLETLAQAQIDEVLHLWTGLGYYARARNLHKTAQRVCERHNGVLPENFDDLIELPGIGRSTAGAILAQAHEQPIAILDGNVKRVLTRLHAIEGWPGTKTIENELWELAQHYTPKKRAGDYTQAIMDLGATICTRKKTRCEDCPVQNHCLAFAHEKVDMLPTPKPRAALPEKSAFMLVLHNDRRHIFLEKRPEYGLWGGLWCFPQFEQRKLLNAWCRQQSGIETRGLVKLPEFTHTFSHFKLRISPLLTPWNNPILSVMDGDQQLWYNPRRPQRVGLPTPIKRVLKQASELLEQNAV